MGGGLLLWSAAGLAEPFSTFVTRLEVERAAGSEACPDVDGVFQAIARLFPDRAIRRATETEPSVASARVSIRPISLGHEALVVVTVPRVGERSLVENDVRCSGLAEALAVTLVMLLEPPEQKRDAEPDQPKAETPVAETVPVAEERPAPPLAPPKPKAAVAADFDHSESGERPRAREKSITALVDASGVGGFGLLGKPAIGGALGLSLYHRSGWGLTGSGLRLWAVPAKAVGGTVTLSLWGGLLGPCYRRQLLGSSKLDACLLVGWGRQQASVEGFLKPEPKTVTWATLGPRLRYVQEVTPSISGFAGLGVLGQLLPQSFSVTQPSGSEARLAVAEAPRVGLMAELGLRVGGEIF